MKKYFFIALLIPCIAQAQDDELDADLSLEEIMNRNLVDMSIEDWVNLDDKELNQLSFYGFLNFNAEKVFHEPSLDAAGNTIYETSPGEMSTPAFHLYAGSRLSEKFTVFFNLGQSDGNINLVNAWGNWKIKDGFQIRLGRQYRRFGLFNERLDQIPTYLGIEPPELFDGDHLLLPRTTLASIHGEFQMQGRSRLRYFLSTSNAESGQEGSVLPLGLDLRYSSSFFLVGVSGYTSNISGAGSQPTVSLGEGSPSAAILPWMDSDKYVVFGLFSEVRKGNLGIKAAYFTADHDAVRNATQVVELANNGLLNQAQTNRMFRGSTDPNAPTEADVILDGSYRVNTWYIRLGYDINTVKGKFTPYFFLDSYENPETIRSKDFGGDNEAGASDNGRFLKPSIGVVYKPIDQVAIKLDGSTHSYDFNGRSESYSEIRIDFSYMFK
ncbi:MAG: hypothetical protein ABJG47_14955 [Ekhidna sp.]